MIFSRIILAKVPHAVARHTTALQAVRRMACRRHDDQVQTI
jgi:hypothetical protein